MARKRLDMESSIANTAERNAVACRLVVYGKPEGKGRPRFSRADYGIRVYTPAKTERYEDSIKSIFNLTCKDFFAKKGEPVEIEIEAFFEITEKTAKKRKALMAAGEMFPTKKPDWDNIGKVVTDALNGYAWHDDAQIVRASVVKRYTADKPRVEIRIRKGTTV